MLILHEQANPEERETKEKHQREHHPTAAADL
jgi:hypothetical protein